MQSGRGFAVPFSNVVEDGQFAYNSGTIRVMCNKETNTDWLQQVAVDSGDQSQHEMPVVPDHSQSRSDSSHNTSIRRWQTFSPGITEDSYICKVCVR